MKRHEKLPIFPHEVKFEGVTATIYRSKGRLYKGRRYDLFTLAYCWNGQGRRRETFAQFSDAKERSKEVLEAIARGRASILSLDSADVQSYIKARELLDEKGFGVPLHEAVEKFIADRKRHQLIDKPVVDVVGEFIAEKTISGLSK